MTHYAGIMTLCALSIPFLGPGFRKSIFPAKLSTFVHILKVNRLRLRMSNCREFLGPQGPLVQHRACLSAIKIWITNLKAYMDGSDSPGRG